MFAKLNALCNHVFCNSDKKKNFENELTDNLHHNVQIKSTEEKHLPSHW